MLNTMKSAGGMMERNATKTAISIKGAVVLFGLSRDQVRYAIQLHHLRPIDPPTSADRRCSWFPRRQLSHAIARLHPPAARAS